MGLDGEYYTIKTHILAMKPTPIMGVAYHLVSDDKYQQAITIAKKPINKATAFLAFVHRRKDIGGDHKQQNKKVVQRDTKRGNTEESECTFCGRKVHKKDGSFKHIEYPDWWSGKGKQEK